MSYKEGLYIKRMEIGGKYEKHKNILYLLLEMSNTSGAVLNPLPLAHAIRDYLKENRPNKNNVEQARNAAYVYACLCNEFRLLVKYEFVRDEFFMTQDKWDKYMIGRKARENSVKLLKEMGWIDYYNKVVRSKPIFRPRMYNINLEALRNLSPEIKKLHSKCTKEEWTKKLNENKSVNNLNDKRSYANSDDDYDNFTTLEEMYEMGWHL